MMAVRGAVVRGGAYDIAVVAETLVGGAEDGVGFGELDEAFGCLGVVGVVVGVVALGEGVEGFLYVFGRGIGGDLEGVIVIRVIGSLGYAVVELPRQAKGGGR